MKFYLIFCKILMTLREKQISLLLSLIKTIKNNCSKFCIFQGIPINCMLIFYTSISSSINFLSKQFFLDIFWALPLIIIKWNNHLQLETHQKKGILMLEQERNEELRNKKKAKSVKEFLYAVLKLDWIVLIN